MKELWCKYKASDWWLVRRGNGKKQRPETNVATVRLMVVVESTESCTARLHCHSVAMWKKLRG